MCILFGSCQKPWFTVGSPNLLLLLVFVMIREAVLFKLHQPLVFLGTAQYIVIHGWFSGIAGELSPGGFSASILLSCNTILVAPRTTTPKKYGLTKGLSTTIVPQLGLRASFLWGVAVGDPPFDYHDVCWGMSKPSFTADFKGAAFSKPLFWVSMLAVGDVPNGGKAPKTEPQKEANDRLPLPIHFSGVDLLLNLEGIKNGGLAVNNYKVGPGSS